MTYDDDLQQVIAGLSFYGCVNLANIDTIYHHVPANRSQINEVMCGLFNRTGDSVGLVGMAIVHCFTPINYIARTVPMLIASTTGQNL